MEFLQFALPSGFIGAVVTWLVNRRKLQTESTKTTYENLMEIIQNQSNDINKVYKELALFRRAVESRNNCKYLLRCPVDHVLHGAKKDVNKQTRRERYDNHEGSDEDGVAEGTIISGIPPPVS